MKILILTQWYPPEPALLIQELAQELSSKGNDVTVLTGFPNYPLGRVYADYRIRFWQHETLEGIRVIRVPLYPNHSQSGVKRLFNYLSFALSASLLGLWLAPRPDAIFVYHPPLTIGLSAWVLSRLWRVGFVYQVQDMWPETLRATGMIKNHHLLSITGRFAKWVYSKASSILVISPGFRKNLIDKGVPAQKITFIPNWTEGGNLENITPNNELAESLGMSSRFNIMFAGNIGEAQSLETALDAAKLLDDLVDTQFVFVGAGISLDRLKNIVQDQGITNVKFLGRFPQKAMPSLYALADVLFVHLKDDPLFRITIPHKIITYLGVGKPILAAIAGDSADIIQETGAGIVCPPGDAQALARAIRSLRAMSVDERTIMGERGLCAASAKYNRKNIVIEIWTLLEKASRANC